MPHTNDFAAVPQKGSGGQFPCPRLLRDLRDDAVSRREPCLAPHDPLTSEEIDAQIRSFLDGGFV